MRRWLQKLPVLAAFSLIVHLAVVTVTKLLVPPPWYPPVSALATEMIPLTPLRDPPKPVVPESELHFGEKEGEGRSINSLDLPDQARSERVYDVAQAWTTRKPAVATESQPEQQSKQAAALVPSGMATELPAMSKQAIGKGESQTTVAPPDDRPREKTASDGKSKEGTTGEDQLQKKAAAESGEVDPAPQGMSDSDQFAEAEGVSLVGGMKARKGRELRFARPRVDLAFRSAYTRVVNEGSFVAFRITTDDKGHARNVILLHSSGSSDIDDSLRLAVYESWFGGKTPDTFVFVIDLHR